MKKKKTKMKKKKWQKRSQWYPSNIVPLNRYFTQYIKNFFFFERQEILTKAKKYINKNIN